MNIILSDIRIDDDCDDLWHNINPNIINIILENISILAKQLIIYNIIDTKNYTIDILLSNDDNIQKINQQWRDKDKPTNILSFPDGEITPDGHCHLGDMMLGGETIKKEAIEQQKSIEHHLIHLLLHSILHLCDYNHENEQDAKEMEQLEIDILAEIGIKDPYQ